MELIHAAEKMALNSCDGYDKTCYCNDPACQGQED